MWWSYLLENRHSSLFPLPWRAWRMRISVGARVREITTAEEWVAFVSEFAFVHDGLAYPAWREVAALWDGIHMTAAAVAATQGLCFRGKRLTTAPAYWDVESTLWLRWVFEDVAPSGRYDR